MPLVAQRKPSARFLRAALAGERRQEGTACADRTDHAWMGVLIVMAGCGSRSQVERQEEEEAAAIWWRSEKVCGPRL